ncbi:MAG: hypothetical protein WDA59_05140 [Methanofastidiosum sp.]|jgi:hypothetical protein
MTKEQFAKYKRYIPSSLSEVKKVAELLYKNFQYTPDDLTKAYDSIDSPISCWLRAFENSGRLCDDCDGFHSALYWPVSYNFECRLLTIVTQNIKDSHTFLTFKTNDGYYYVDYTYLSPPFANMDDLVMHAENRLYKNKTFMISYELSKWDGGRWQTSRRYLS